MVQAVNRERKKTMTSDEVNRLADKMEDALHRKNLSLYQALRSTVFGHDRLAVDGRVRVLKEERQRQKKRLSGQRNDGGFSALAQAIMYPKLIIAGALLLAALSGARAGDKEKHEQKREHEPNYILRRQEAGLVRGTPIRSFYVGHRRIDYYRDGSAFEKDVRVQ
jgi:hypothetical protein